MASPRLNLRAHRAGWTIHVKLGTGPSGYLRVKGGPRLLSVGDEIEALSVPFVHGERWTRWRIREIDATQIPRFYRVSR